HCSPHWPDRPAPVPVQTWPRAGLQDMPQPPQFFASMAVLTQVWAPLTTQSLRPLWQLRPQELSLQTNPATHTRPPAPAQPPQLSRSLVVSTHLPEPAGHSVVPGVQITLQCPETQCVPERQALLPAPLEAVVQAPQL